MQYLNTIRQRCGSTLRAAGRGSPWVLKAWAMLLVLTLIAMPLQPLGKAWAQTTHEVVLTEVGDEIVIQEIDINGNIIDEISYTHSIDLDDDGDFYVTDDLSPYMDDVLHDDDKYIYSDDPNRDADYAPATEEGPWNNRICPVGTFSDIPTGTCWSCPDGYYRTAAAVERHNACRRAPYNEWSRYASKRRATGWFKTDCPSGYFLHGLSGSCYKCPSGYKRSLQDINGSKACYKTVPQDFSAAKFHGKHRCSEYPGSFADLIHGGTCWSCPAYFARGVLPVTNDRACSNLYPGFRPRLSAPKVPGLTGLSGGREIREEILALQGTSWEAIKDDPQEVADFKGLVFARFIAAVEQGPEDRHWRFVQSMADYTQKQRIQIVTDTQDNIQRWKRYMETEHKRADIINGTRVALYDLGPVPPDLLAHAKAAILLGSYGVATVASIGSVSAYGSYVVSQIAAATGLVAKDVTGFEATLYFMSRNAAGMLNFLKVAGGGPVAILAAVIVTGVLVIDHYAKLVDVDIKLQNAMRDAQRPVDIKKMIDNEPEQLTYFYALATQ